MGLGDLHIFLFGGGGGGGGVLPPVKVSCRWASTACLGVTAPVEDVGSSVLEIGRQWLWVRVVGGLGFGLRFRGTVLRTRFVRARRPSYLSFGGGGVLCCDLLGCSVDGLAQPAWLLLLLLWKISREVCYSGHVHR